MLFPYRILHADQMQWRLLCNNWDALHLVTFEFMISNPAKGYLTLLFCLIIEDREEMMIQIHRGWGLFQELSYILNLFTNKWWFERFDRCFSTVVGRAVGLFLRSIATLLVANQKYHSSTVLPSYASLRLWLTVYVFVNPITCPWWSYSYLNR